MSILDAPVLLLTILIGVTCVIGILIYFFE
jgi:hypothetical protein